METSPAGSSKDEVRRLLKAGQIDEAITAINALLETQPDDPQLHTLLGVACSENGDKLHAIGAFERSVGLQETPKSCYNLGQIYESVNRVDEAVRQYETAIGLDSAYKPAQDALARLHAKFEADHPQAPPAAPDATQAIPPQSGPVGLEPTQVVPPYPGGPQPPVPPGPNAFEDRRRREDMEVELQRQKMIRSGLIYGVICGAGFFLFIYAVMALFAAPMAMMVGGGTSLLLGIFVGTAVGAVFGGLVGLWIGHTCGGDMAGLQAGAVIGAVFGLGTGIIGGAGGAAIVSMFMCALLGGVLGWFIGRMVDASIGWD